MSSLRNINGLILILTAQCNLRCSYCYQTAKKPLSMDWPTLRASIDMALSSRTTGTRLAFLGGEPLLQFTQIQKTVHYVARNTPSRKHISYVVGTNGLLMTEDVAAFLDRHEFEVQLSLDGIAEAQDFRHKGSFPEMDALLDRLRRQQPGLFRDRLRVIMTLIPANVSYLAESIRYLTNMGIRHITVSAGITPFPDWKRESIRDLDAQFSRIFDDSLRHFKKTGAVPLYLFRKKTKRPGQSSANCDMCSLISRKALVIDVDGQVYGCVMFAESYQQLRSEFFKARLAPLKMGSIRDPGFRESYAAFPAAVRRAEMFDHKERKHSSYGKCAECEYLKSCSICPAAIGHALNNADPHRIPDFVCAFNRVALKYRDRFPLVPDPREKFAALLETRETGD